MTRFELFCQGIGVSKMANKALRYIRKLKIDFLYIKVICYTALRACKPQQLYGVFDSALLEKLTVLDVERGAC